MPGFDHTLLWELSTTESENTCYLFGTMHAHSDEAYHYYSIAEKYIKKCNQYCGEINLNEGSSNGEFFYFENGKGLKDFVGEKKYNKLLFKFGKYFMINLDLFSRFKPLIIQNMILESSVSKTNQLALDFELKNFAQNMGLTIGGVETIQEQEQIFSKIPLDIQLKMLVSMTKNIKKTRKSFSRMIDQYKEASLEGLYKTTKRSLGGLRKIMLFDRNKVMADRIALQMKSGNIFFAIGAAHLGGSKGVLNLLSKKGIKVRPIIDQNC